LTGGPRRPEDSAPTFPLKIQRGRPISILEIPLVLVVAAILAALCVLLVVEEHVKPAVSRRKRRD
jgi:hypothetical protein